MSEVTVGTRIPDQWFTDAGASQMLPSTTSKSGIIRMALGFFQGMSAVEARQLAITQPKPGKGIADTTDRKIDIACKVPEELAEGIKDIGAAYAVRIGVIMALGYTREQAERVAKMSPGRPRKEKAN